MLVEGTQYRGYTKLDTPRRLVGWICFVDRLEDVIDDSVFSVLTCHVLGVFDQDIVVWGFGKWTSHNDSTIYCHFELDIAIISNI